MSAIKAALTLARVSFSQELSFNSDERWTFTGGLYHQVLSPLSPRAGRRPALRETHWPDRGRHLRRKAPHIPKDGWLESERGKPQTTNRGQHGTQPGTHRCAACSHAGRPQCTPARLAGDVGVRERRREHLECARRGGALDSCRTYGLDSASADDP